ncbi:hypothetical protein [Sphingobacterium sp. CZ-2]|uniref:hypothetical protein n=1 Tax=Sphingobacterium sp. CZ-2 TaxID=2557994 RepID=UPI00106FD430|nr:hypothetical protein [Sphingobacterium sp. CZ-2]QBR13699.1 hypothetical protein E3D81_16525 [Sphingobacterium sp. CZ-2]
MLEALWILINLALVFYGFYLTIKSIGYLYKAKGVFPAVVLGIYILSLFAHQIESEDQKYEINNLTFIIKNHEQLLENNLVTKVILRVRSADGQTKLLLSKNGLVPGLDYEIENATLYPDHIQLNVFKSWKILASL